MQTIALVDDDHNLLTSTRIALEAQSYRVVTFSDGVSALEAFQASLPDLAILDIKMPRMDGMELLRRLRQNSNVPAIFLTCRHEAHEEVRGLQIGADDFIRKPFSHRVLVARIKMVLRRAAPRRSSSDEDSSPGTLACGHLYMDPERQACTWKGYSVTLTVTEFLILQALASRPDTVKSRDALLGAAYDQQLDVDERAIDSHVKRLRNRFRAVDKSFDMIESLYGVGYRFRGNRVSSTPPWIARGRDRVR